MSETKTIKLRNFHLGLFSRWLQKPIAAKDRRMMYRFIDLLEDPIRHYEEDRKKINEEYCDKDENNNPIIKITSGVSHYTFETSLGNGRLTKYDEEMNELANAEITLDILPSVSEAVLKIRENLSELDERFDTSTQDGRNLDIAYRQIMSELDKLVD